jgi:hypothetical protein
MTYGRVRLATHKQAADGAVVSHLAELVRGKFLRLQQGPLIRPSGTFSPRGEGTVRHRYEDLSKVDQSRARVRVPR